MDVAILGSYPRGDVPESGVAYFTRTLANLLKAEGLSVGVFAERDGREDETDEGVQRCYSKSLAGVFAAAHALLRVRARYALVQFTPWLFGSGIVSTYYGLLLFAYLRLRGLRFVVEIHDLRALVDLRPQIVQGKTGGVPWGVLRAGYRLLYFLIGRLAFHIVVHNTTHRDLLRDDFAVDTTRVTVIDHIVAPVSSIDRSQARANLDVSSQTCLILFFGYAIAYKGLDLLLAVAQRFACEGESSVTFAIASGPNPVAINDGPYRKYYDDLAERFAALPNVRWVGFLEANRVATYFSACDAIVLPYVSEMAASGPLSMSFAYGRTALMSTRIAPREAPRALCFEPDEVSLYSIIERFSSDPVLRCFGETYALASRDADRLQPYLSLFRT